MTMSTRVDDWCVIARAAPRAESRTHVPTPRYEDTQPFRTTGAPLARKRAEARHMVVKIIANDKGNPPGKLADAEIHFTDGPFEGLKLIGFAVWERKTVAGRNVTFPARSYSTNGERRSFSLLRPIADSTASNRLRDLILAAYEDHAAALAATA